MAGSQRVLLPGYGGMFTSVSVGSTDTVIQEFGGDLNIDLSLCDNFAIQVTSTAQTPAGTIQLEQTFNNSTWASLGSTVNVATDAVALFDATDGPFGKIRINATGITAGSVTVSVVGFKIGAKF